MARTVAGVTASGGPPPREPYPFAWRTVVIVFAAAGALRFATFYLDDLTRGLAGTWMTRAVEEGTGALGALLLFPFVCLVERRFPLDRGQEGNWRRGWWAHLLAWIAYSVAHTTFMWGCRVALLPMLGGGPYDYGRMSVRYVMESPNDLFVYCAFLGVLTLLRTQQTLRDREVRVAALARDAAEAQLQSLSLRLHPHFLFNALNTISSTVYDNAAAADEMIGQLGELLRRALEMRDRPEVALADELEALDAYLALVGARFGDRIRCELEVDPRALPLAVPAFILQPLVENAVRHGTVVEHPSTIALRIQRQAEAATDALCITVENEIPADRSDDGPPGTGLSTTRDRLRLLYGDDHAFVAGAAGNRFVVNIRIPARDAPAAATTRAAHAIADR